jgi:predicted amino acid dehydrogenase
MKKFAFLVHPRISAREDMGKVFFPFYFFPERILQGLTPFLNPVARGKVCFKNNKEIIGWIIVIPLLAKQILYFPRDLVFKKILKGIELAKRLGVEIVGLGEFIASVTQGGKDLVRKVEGITIINGKSLTAGVSFKAIEEISKIKDINLKKERVAIIGAGGSIGRGISFLFLEKNIPLILIDKTKKIEDLKKSFNSFNDCEISDQISLIKEARIVIVATSSVDQIIKPDYLKKEAIIYDLTQPRNTSPNILKERKDVIIIDGGIIDTPCIDYGMDIGLKKNQAYACLAETIICALEDIKEDYVGHATSESAKKMLNLMEKYQDYFKLNIFQSFGKPLNNNLEFIN